MPPTLSTCVSITVAKEGNADSSGYKNNLMRSNRTGFATVATGMTLASHDSDDGNETYLLLERLVWFCKEIDVLVSAGIYTKVGGSRVNDATFALRGA